MIKNTFYFSASFWVMEFRILYLNINDLYC